MESTTSLFKFTVVDISDLQNAAKKGVCRRRNEIHYVRVYVYTGAKNATGDNTETAAQPSPAQPSLALPNPA